MISPADPRIDALLDQLSLEEKVQLLTGRDFWTTWPIEHIGLRRMLLSDGPSGVRGEFWDERDPSLNLPSASALSSTWDPEMAKRYGAAAAVEARRKGVDVVLGPTINMHRSPLGGRHFEAFSEDPVLTSDLSAAFVEGVQANGVAATPKHYIANDYETDRFTASTVVSEKALREVYLLAFEKSVTEARAWAVMSSYNSINGVTATENELLETPLNDEWGFDGVVVSDWTGVRSLESARHAQDLVMPGPGGPWGDALVAAVRSGEVEEAAVDRKVRRILTLAARVGAIEGIDPVQAAPTIVEDGIAFAREAASAGMVLLRNEGVLPIESAPSKIAVIGHNATVARTMGGGSATVIPERIVSPLEGIRRAFPDSEVTYSVGAVVQSGVAELPLAELTNPATGVPGVRARFLHESGAELYTEDRRATHLVWFGSDAPISETDILELSTTWTPQESGRVRLGFASVGHAVFQVDGHEVLDATAEAEGTDLGAALLSPGVKSADIDTVAGRPVDIVITYRRPRTDGGLDGAMAFSFGLEATGTDAEELLREAVQQAQSADMVVLVVGTNAAVESEGFDRTDLDLPGRQNELAHRVLAVNANSVVVVNSGSPVVMPWREEAGAVLLSWFGGQEMGDALGDVLTGSREPGGRLPTTWPAAQADVPVIDVTPLNGEVHYDEGIHIGYRAWLRAGVTPAYPFGFGLGYTSWDVTPLGAQRDPDGAITVRAEVTNTGNRTGKQVVQVYASRPDSQVERPAQWLVGFAAVTLEAGATTELSIKVPDRAFAHWDAGWQMERGEYIVSLGTSVGDIIAKSALTL